MTSPTGGPRQITSRDNPQYKAAVQLVASARERRRERASFIEGIHLCAAYRARHGVPRLAFATPQAHANPEVAATLAGLEDRLIIVPAGLFAALSQVAHGMAVGFVIDTPAPAIPRAIVDDGVYLDRLQDPGNVGTILRACAATGVRRVFTAPDTAFCWSPKVLRAAMGAHFHLDIHESVPWETVRERLGVPCLATRATDAAPVWDVPLVAPCLWVFGNEGAGVAPSIADSSVGWVRIPQADTVESLNVAIAAAVCLFEQARQRRAARPLSC